MLNLDGIEYISVGQIKGVLILKQLNGKVAIITGANQGLGLQIANHYINNGANIAICARNKSKLLM